MNHTIEHVLLCDWLHGAEPEYDYEECPKFPLAFLNKEGEVEMKIIEGGKFVVPVCKREQPLKVAVQSFMEHILNNALISDVDHFGMENVYKMAVSELRDIIPDGEEAEIGHIFVSRKMYKDISVVKSKDVKRWYSLDDTISYDFQRRIIVLDMPENTIAFSPYDYSFGVTPIAQNEDEYGIGIITDRLITYRLSL